MRVFSGFAHKVVNENSFKSQKIARNPSYSQVVAPASALMAEPAESWQMSPTTGVA
jgi:hypothetical protein